MTVPQTQITKTDGNTGVTTPAASGILAIIAPGSGTANQVSSVANAKAALTAQGYTPLTAIAALVMALSGKSVVLIPPTTSTAATYGTVTKSGTGTFTPTAGVTSPLDDYDVLVKFIAGGTIGVTGITYTYSLDNGQNTSAVQSLGTASSIVIPNSGITISLGAGTIVAADSFVCSVKGARPSDSDVSTALEALRTSALPYEGILVFEDATASTVSVLDTWLAAREAEGKFKHAYLGMRVENAAESDATYQTAMTTAMASASSTRCLVSGGGVRLASAIPGTAVVQTRQAHILAAARAMAIDISRDPAYVADGPVPGSLYDLTGAPLRHDEAVNPGLDDIRMTSLRTIPGQFGTYINNAKLASPAGSDYVFLQHTRVMNRACELTYQILTNQLSIGVKAQKNTQIGPGVYITEDDAQRIESLVNGKLDSELVRAKRVSDSKFVLSRSDDLSSNQGATLSGDVRVSALRYVKKFQVNAFFVKTVAAAA